MKLAILLAALLASHALAASVIASALATGTSPELVDGQPPAATLDDPGVFVRGAWRDVRAGNYYSAAALVVIFLVALLRLGGQALHDWLRDDHPLDRVLFFLFDTKPGRVAKLFLTTAAAGVGGAWLLGEPITPQLVNPILGVTFASSTLYGWLKDFVEWPGSERVLGAKLRDVLVRFLGLKVVPS